MFFIVEKILILNIYFIKGIIFKLENISIISKILITKFKSITGRKIKGKKR